MKKIIFGIVGILFCMLLAMIIYLQIYYHSENIADEYLKSTDEVSVEKIDKGYFFDGKGEDSALIFYQGAKVEEKAYSKLLYNLANNGIDCFLLTIPFRFAFFGINYSDDIINKYNYENWYLSGHSLGGVAASMYLSETDNDIKGLILLASYPTQKVKDNTKLISIYGENDGVLDVESYENSKIYWPNNSTEYVIECGNHAGFANYGEQSGDNTADITQDEQQEKTIEIIINNYKN